MSLFRKTRPKSALIHPPKTENVCHRKLLSLSLPSSMCEVDFNTLSTMPQSGGNISPDMGSAKSESGSASSEDIAERFNSSWESDRVHHSPSLIHRHKKSHRHVKRILSGTISSSEGSYYTNEDLTYICDGFPADFASWNKLVKASVVKIRTNDIRNVPDTIQKLECRELKLTRNTTQPGEGLKHLGGAIALVRNLEVLSLHGNHFQSYPDDLFKHPKLRELHLDYCGIVRIPVSISFNSNIRKLTLDYNGISTIEDYSFKYMYHLQHLSLAGNKLRHLGPLHITNLITLDLSDNNLESIAPEAFQHTLYMERLDLRFNRLKVFPSSLFKLKNLKVLDVSCNEIVRLPEEIKNLRNLCYLNISYNALTSLPKEVGELKIECARFLCGENPLLKPPKNVCLKGVHDIAAYYTALERAPGIHNRRMKILLLGESNAGKTSLAKAMKYSVPSSSDPDCSTIGIDFFNWKAEPLKDNGLEVLIVDCAGQKQYLLTHQLFLSTDMLFVVVVDLDQYCCTEKCFKERIGGWVETILARVPDAAITVAPTFLDKFSDESNSEVLRRCEHVIQMLHEADEQRGRRIDQELSRMSLQGDNHDRASIKRHHSIHERRPALPTSILFNGQETLVIKSDRPLIKLIPLSNENGLEGIEEFGKEILRIANDSRLCPNIARELPASWIKLEEYCIKLQESRTEETSVVEKKVVLQGFNDSCGCNLSMVELQSALRYLDSVGRVLDFDIGAVKDLVFLSPLWLLRLLKKLFRHNLDAILVYENSFMKEHLYSCHEFEQAKLQLLKNARLCRGLLKCIWFSSHVDDELLDKFVDVLNYFGLLFKVEDGPSPAYVVPWFLNAEKPLAVEQGWPATLEPNEVQTVTLLHIGLGPLPEGVFRRFIVSAHALSPDCLCWSAGILIMMADSDKILCTFEPREHSCDIYVRARCHKDRVEDLWKPALRALKMVKDLVDEWPGLLPYNTYAVCPSCDLVGLRPSHIWPLDFKPCHRVVGTKHCMKEPTTVSSSLLFPPPDAVLDVIVGKPSDDFKPSKNIQEMLSIEEKYHIASMVGDKLKQMARILGLSDGQIEAILLDNPFNHGEQVYKVLQTWERSVSGKATRSMFVERLKRMIPRPRDIIEFVLYE